MVQIKGAWGPGTGAGSHKTFAQSTRPFFYREGQRRGSHEDGMLVIDEDGVFNTYYLPGAVILDGGKTVKYTPPYRYYLMLSPTTDYSEAENFYKPNLVGKTFTVDIDFGRHGASCGCNLNFYLVNMPVGFPGKDHDYYCDAQCFPNVGCCAEFDMNEGNMIAQQVTNHACTGDYTGHPDWVCSKWGNPWDKTHPDSFGIGGAGIDSRKSFTWSQMFEKVGKDLSVVTTMSQGNYTHVLRLGPGNRQMNVMMRELEMGMAFVTGYWSAPDMNWLDGEVCGHGPEDCNMRPAYISNWRITSNGSPVPTPAPVPIPSPPPQPAGHYCCWSQGCSSCQEDADHWCNKNQASCDGCAGMWCPRS
jgi:hypothetical protein